MKIITNDGTEYIVTENSIPADIIIACINAANSHDIERHSPVNSDTLKLFDEEGKLIPYSEYEDVGLEELAPQYAFLGTREAYDVFVNAVRSYATVPSFVGGGIAVWYDCRCNGWVHMNPIEYAARKHHFDVYADVARKLHLEFLEHLDD